jgi:hypothetical protein
LFFAIYGEAIYHHGAGFRRDDLSRAQLEGGPALRPIPRSRLLQAPVKRLNWQRQRRFEEGVRERQRADSERIYEALRKGEQGWLEELR